MTPYDLHDDRPVPMKGVARQGVWQTEGGKQAWTLGNNIIVQMHS